MLFTNDQFTESIKSYQKDSTEFNGRILGRIFYTLTDSVFEVCDRSKSMFFNIEAVKEHCVFSCFESLAKFNSIKGKAFNYFTTIILNQARKMYRTQKEDAIRREKYGKFIRH